MIIEKKKLPKKVNKNQLIYITGKGHYKDKIISEKEIAYTVSQIKELGEISSYLRKINGFYAVVVCHSSGDMLLAVDHVRSKPLFYKTDGSWSNNAFKLAPHNETINDNTTASFLKSGWTIGETTLVSNVFQVRAGEHIIITPQQKIERIKTFSHLHSNNLKNNNKQEIRNLLWEKSNTFTDRLIEIADGRPIAVPLSGGYDSRYIAAMLKIKNAKNVILLSYGKEDSFEISTARKVAKKLDYRWEMIDYNSLFLRKYIASEEFKHYCYSASGGASLPHIQEFAMLAWLREQKIIPNNSIFAPGFCGDLIGGSYIPALVKTGNSQNLINKGLGTYIRQKLFYLENSLTESQDNSLQEEINRTLQGIAAHNGDEFCSEFEAWFTEHKVSKFVINAVRAYEFFGYDWHLPLWDHDLIKFWYQVPLDQRINKTLYDRFLLEEIFTPFGIDFKKQHSWLTSGVTGVLRPRIPPAIKDPMKKIYYETSRFISRKRFHDQNGFHEIALWFSNELAKGSGIKEKVSDNINQIEILWFLANLDSIKKHVQENIRS